MKQTSDFTHNNLNVNNLCGFSDEVHIVINQLQNFIVVWGILVADSSALNYLECVKIDFNCLNPVTILILC